MYQTEHGTLRNVSAAVKRSKGIRLVALRLQGFRSQRGPVCTCKVSAQVSVPMPHEEAESAVSKRRARDAREYTPVKSFMSCLDAESAVRWSSSAWAEAWRMDGFCQRMIGHPQRFQTCCMIPVALGRSPKVTRHGQKMTSGHNKRPRTWGLPTSSLATIVVPNFIAAAPTHA